ncbi:hypothetical protein Tco_0671348 [Tanacetum coccineum]
MSAATIERLVNQRVADALAVQEGNRNYGNGNGNINGDVNVNGDGNANVGGVVPIPRACTYKDFLNCQLLNFKGIEGAIGLARWFEKVESVFHISNCSINYQVKFVTCMLQDGERTMEPHGQGTDMVKYTQRFQELTLLCLKMVPDEEEKVERLQDAIKMANILMDQKVRTFAAKNVENKRKLENDPRDNRVQQPPFKRQNVA